MKAEGGKEELSFIRRSSSAMKLSAVFGLGNPGEEYDATRHNVGFEVVGRLAEGYGVRVLRRRFQALVAEAETEAGRLFLVKPQTYVNQSGASVKAIVAWYELSPEEILVVCDDLDLEFGTIRVRRGGSSGGHNGLKSIAAALGTTEFPRLRIGIGRPRPEKAVDYVLGRFSKAQNKVIGQAVETAADAVRCCLTEGIAACMNKFN